MRLYIFTHIYSTVPWVPLGTVLSFNLGDMIKRGRSHPTTSTKGTVNGTVDHVGEPMAGIDTVYTGEVTVIAALLARYRLAHVLPVDTFCLFNGEKRKNSDAEMQV